MQCISASKGVAPLVVVARPLVFVFCTNSVHDVTRSHYKIGMTFLTVGSVTGLSPPSEVMIQLENKKREG